jgi:hypothetical protein
MDDISDFTDMSKYGLEARIYSADGKYKKIITDKDFLEKINQCHHPTALFHETKDIITEVERILLPLKSQSASLFIETKGGAVVSRMTLEDFFNLLDIGKRIEIKDRFQISNPEIQEDSPSIDKEILEFLDRLSGK